MSSHTHEICADTAIPDQRPSLIGRVGHAIRAAFDAYAEERARNETVRILRELDDRTLNDIGVDRSEICSLVYGNRLERRWPR